MKNLRQQFGLTESYLPKFIWQETASVDEAVASPIPTVEESTPTIDEITKGITFTDDFERTEIATVVDNLTKVADTKARAALITAMGEKLEERIKLAGKTTVEGKINYSSIEPQDALSDLLEFYEALVEAEFKAGTIKLEQRQSTFNTYVNTVLDNVVPDPNDPDKNPNQASELLDLDEQNILINTVKVSARQATGLADDNYQTKITEAKKTMQAVADDIDLYDEAGTKYGVSTLAMDRKTERQWKRINQKVEKWREEKGKTFAQMLAKNKFAEATDPDLDGLPANTRVAEFTQDKRDGIYVVNGETSTVVVLGKAKVEELAENFKSQVFVENKNALEVESNESVFVVDHAKAAAFRTELSSTTVENTDNVSATIQSLIGSVTFNENKVKVGGTEYEIQAILEDLDCDSQISDCFGKNLDNDQKAFVKSYIELEFTRHQLQQLLPTVKDDGTYEYSTSLKYIYTLDGTLINDSTLTFENYRGDKDVPTAQNITNLYQSFLQAQQQLAIASTNLPIALPDINTNRDLYQYGLARAQAKANLAQNIEGETDNGNLGKLGVETDKKAYVTGVENVTYKDGAINSVTSQITNDVEDYHDMSAEALKTKQTQLRTEAENFLKENLKFTPYNDLVTKNPSTSGFELHKNNLVRTNTAALPNAPFVLAPLADNESWDKTSAKPVLKAFEAYNKLINNFDDTPTDGNKNVYVKQVLLSFTETRAKFSITVNEEAKTVVDKNGKAITSYQALYDKLVADQAKDALPDTFAAEMAIFAKFAEEQFGIINPIIVDNNLNKAITAVDALVGQTFDLEKKDVTAVKKEVVEEEEVIEAKAFSSIDGGGTAASPYKPKDDNELKTLAAATEAITVDLSSTPLTGNDNVLDADEAKNLATLAVNSKVTVEPKLNFKDKQIDFTTLSTDEATALLEIMEVDNTTKIVINPVAQPGIYTYVVSNYTGQNKLSFYRKDALGFLILYNPSLGGIPLTDPADLHEQAETLSNAPTFPSSCDITLIPRGGSNNNPLAMKWLNDNPVAKTALNSPTTPHGLQQNLKKLGFTPGTLDGVFGQKTLNALNAFLASKAKDVQTGVTSRSNEDLGTGAENLTGGAAKVAKIKTSVTRAEFTTIGQHNWDAKAQLLATTLGQNNLSDEAARNLVKEIQTHLKENCGCYSMDIDGKIGDGTLAAIYNDD